jgi:hypothetical protein
MNFPLDSVQVRHSVAQAGKGQGRATEGRRACHPDRCRICRMRPSMPWEQL